MSNISEISSFMAATVVHDLGNCCVKQLDVA